MNTMTREILRKTLKTINSRSEAYNDMYRVLFFNASSQALVFKSLNRRYKSTGTEHQIYIETMDFLLPYLPVPTLLQGQNIARQMYRFGGWREGLESVLEADMSRQDIQEEISDLEHRFRHDKSPRMKSTSSVYMSAVGRLEAYRYCLMRLKES
jgi:hypothetical protein